MIFEVVEHLFEHFFVGAILVVVAFVTLLPLEREKDVFTLLDFLPVFASRHDLSDKVSVVAHSHVILEGFVDGEKDFGSLYLLGYSTRSLDILFITKNISLSRDNAYLFHDWIII